MTFALAHAMPAGTIVVAESGIRTAEHLRRLHAAGIHAALIGERLMREPDPALALEALRADAVEEMPSNPGHSAPPC